MEKFYSSRLQCDVRQIRKDTARKLFTNYVTIYLLSSNMAFDNVWQEPYRLNRNSYDMAGRKYTFESICNNYRYFNCDGERGKEIKFYVKS